MDYTKKVALFFQLGHFYPLKSKKIEIKAMDFGLNVRLGGSIKGTCSITKKAHLYRYYWPWALGRFFLIDPPYIHKYLFSDFCVQQYRWSWKLRFFSSQNDPLKAKLSDAPETATSFYLPPYVCPHRWRFMGGERGPKGKPPTLQRKASGADLEQLQWHG